jgi:PAS domain S-box-containing protein
MGRVAPFGSDIAGLLFETCSDALETGILVFSKSDNLVAVSRNIGNFYPVSNEFLQPGVSLRTFLAALFEVIFVGDAAAIGTRSGASREEWISNRIAAMWHERAENVEKLGRERWLSVTTRRLANGIGILMVQDVSARRKMEERWRADLERVAMTEDILDNLPSMLFVLDRNLQHVAVNKAYRRFHGLPPESILDHGLGEILDPETAHRFEHQARGVLATGKVLVEYDHLDIDGRHVPVLKQYFRLGTPGHYFVAALLQDVSETPSQARTLPDFDQSQPTVEDIAEADFGGVNIGGEPFAPAPARSSSVILLSSDEAFGDALNDALRAFRFDTCHALNIEEASAILSAAREAGLKVDLIMADEHDIDASALRGMGIQVLPVSRSRPVHFAVAEAAAAATRSMVSRPLEQDSDYLPDFPMPDRVPDPSGLGAEILVVEDNPINQEVYAQILGGLGISYELARDGEEALRLWDVLRPPLILMDLDLPDMSGLDATRRIRASECHGAGRARIVGVMPRPSHERHEECLANGMDETIIKPLSVEVIEAVYHRYAPTDLHNPVDLMIAH